MPRLPLFVVVYTRTILKVGKERIEMKERVKSVLFLYGAESGRGGTYLTELICSQVDRPSLDCMSAPE
jgi:hypothetical protein